MPAVRSRAKPGATLPHLAVPKFKRLFYQTDSRKGMVALGWRQLSGGA